VQPAQQLGQDADWEIRARWPAGGVHRGCWCALPDSAALPAAIAPPATGSTALTRPRRRHRARPVGDAVLDRLVGSAVLADLPARWRARDEVSNLRDAAWDRLTFS
jgi:hypothetical protein